MKTFQEYVKEKKVIKGSSDPAMSKSLLLQAKNRLADLNGLPITEDNASFRFESAYEVIREAIQSVMTKEGYKPYSHEAVVAYSIKLLNEAEVFNFDRYREIIKTALIPNLKVGVFNRAVFSLENHALKCGVFISHKNPVLSVIFNKK